MRQLKTWHSDDSLVWVRHLASLLPWGRLFFLQYSARFTYISLITLPVLTLHYSEIHCSHNGCLQNARFPREESALVHHWPLCKKHFVVCVSSMHEMYAPFVPFLSFLLLLNESQTTVSEIFITCSLFSQRGLRKAKFTRPSADHIYRSVFELVYKRSLRIYSWCIAFAMSKTR